MIDRVRRFVRRTVRDAAWRLRERGRSALTRAARLAGATVAAFVVAEAVGIRTPPPLVAALTALLVVQVTLSGTLVNGVQRVLSVIAGVVLALGFASVTGLSWWSLGLLVTASIVVGRLLRLGPHLVEVPISAMLVLSVGAGVAADTAAWGRALETLIGAVVGVLVNVLVPPKVQSRDAGRSVVELAADIAALLDEAAVENPDPERATRWLDDARRLNRHVPRVDRALTEAKESRQLNVRALAERDGGIGLRDGLDALEHVSVTLRGLFRAIRDLTADGVPDPRDIPPALPEMLHALARAVRAFGAVLMIESGGHDPAVPEAGLAAALADVRTRWASVGARPAADRLEHPATWELGAALAIAVDRVVSELDVAEHARARAAIEQRRLTLHPPKIVRHRPRPPGDAPSP